MNAVEFCKGFVESSKSHNSEDFVKYVINKTNEDQLKWEIDPCFARPTFCACLGEINGKYVTIYFELDINDEGKLSYFFYKKNVEEYKMIVDLYEEDTKKFYSAVKKNIRRGGRPLTMKEYNESSNKGNPLLMHMMRVLED